MLLGKKVESCDGKQTKQAKEMTKMKPLLLLPFLPTRNFLLGSLLVQSLRILRRDGGDTELLVPSSSLAGRTAQPCTSRGARYAALA